MKTASPALQALLATNQFLVADLYTFTLAGGQVLRWTAFDTDVIANGNTFASGAPGGPFFDRQDNKAKCHWKIGVEVDTLVFDVVPGSATVNALPFLQACRLGVFDGAELQLERAFLAPPVGGVYPPVAASAGTVILFAGRVAEVDLGRSLATFNVNSHLELLNLNLPRNLFQSGCVNSLYDAACGVSKASYAVTGIAAAGSTPSLVNATLAQASGWFDQGSIAFTSGQNAGFARTVKSYTAGSPGTLSLIAPFPFAPAAGDAFTAYPGCDKTNGAGGCAKFANTARFKGFPFVPVPETAV
jgi:hypothetical protein